MRMRLAIGVLMLASALARAGEPSSGILLSAMDGAVRPQDDLFSYANGTWLRTVPIPDDRSRYGIDMVMQETSLLRQRELAERARTARDPDTRRVGDFYASFLDEARIDRLGLAPLRPEMARIRQVKDKSGLAPLMAELELLGVDSAIGSYVQPDAHDPTRYAFWISQGGLGLPDRDYYLSDDPRMAEFRRLYRLHLTVLLRLAGEKGPEARAGAVLDLETRIARLQWTTVDRRNPEKTYNPRTLAQLSDLAPAFDWQAYATAQNLPASQPIIVARQPDYLANLSALVGEAPLSVWKDYLETRLLASAAPYLAKPFAAEAFHFDESVLHGVQRPPERWKQACETIDRLIGEASGKLYVEAYFPEAARTQAAGLVANIVAAYRESLAGADWMSPQTRQAALDKLGKLTVKLGYPVHWRDYSGLEVSPGDLLGNMQRAQAFEALRKRAQLAGPVDRSEWEMTAPTVDAYYDASTNQFALPAGILQPPLYDPAADDAYNYGSTGATIGHEISHAFDNRGSRYDGDGRLRDWWTPEDHKRYDAIADRLARQFDGFEPLPGYHVDGRLTLSENIADLVGLDIAYRAYLHSLNGAAAPVVGGLTGAQRFFIGYAQSYMGKRRDGLLIAQLKSNPHSPEKFRVDGIVPNLQAFHDAFGVVPGDALYLPPDRRASFW